MFKLDVNCLTHSLTHALIYFLEYPPQLIVFPIVFCHVSYYATGVSHILTSGILMQLLSSAKVINVNHSIKEERALLQGFQKLVAIAIALFQSVSFVFAGFYGSVGVVNGVLIIAQLFGAALVVIYFDEMIQKGYGLGSGISLFTCGAVSLELLWKVSNVVYCVLVYVDMYPHAVLLYID